jgi:predicted AAA+ superfamily ATPase
MIRRNLTQPLLRALADNPVVLLNGARQSGKSTLARQLISDTHPARYLTLDDATILEAAKSDRALPWSACSMSRAWQDRCLRIL